MDLLPEPFRSILAFVVVLGVLVFVHELGHYLAARWRGVHVERFSVGFGRAIAAWTDRHGTEWRIGWIPLGGYVKMHGMETMAGDEPPPGEAPPVWREGQTFHGKSVGDRAIVVAAGPIANFLLAAVLFALLFGTVGRPIQNVVSRVVPGSAAEEGGLMVGDRIVALDGRAVVRFRDIQRRAEAQVGQAVEVTLQREGAERRVTVVPRPRPGDGRGVIGIAGGPGGFEQLDPFSAVWAGISYTAEVSVETLASVGEMITGRASADQFSGPIGIARLSGQVANLGIVALISFVAMLSVNLALINLFPIPILDGGHLLFYAAEAIRGRPLPPRAQEYGLRAGLAVLVSLFLFATWNDLGSLGVVRWVAGLLG